MKSKEELQQLIKTAQELGVPSIVVDGVTFTIPVVAVAQEPIPEGLSIEDIIKQLSPFEEMTDQEILYWSTPYYDELQAKKSKPEEIE